MNNMPLVTINYLVNYDLVIKNTSSEFNQVSNTSNINKEMHNVTGKKGFFLSGGGLDENGNDTGCVMDGTYTFFKSETNSYDGIVGNEFSGSDYAFSSQYIDFETLNNGTYINSILVYFDPIASEYATQISFSDAINEDGTTNNNYNGSTIINNNSLVFIYNFGQSSTIKSIRLNFLKWSKKNSLLKIIKIVTGYTGIYSVNAINSIDFNLNKTNDSSQLRFGVSSNDCVVKIIDNNLTIKSLYEKDLIYKNIQLSITVDGTQQGIYFISEKNSENGTNMWQFECVDKLKLLENIKRPMMAVASRNIKQVVDYVLSGIGLEVSWENSAKTYCESKTIEQSYFKSNQTFYELLLKCCQVGLLRIYMDRNGICKVTRGV